MKRSVLFHYCVAFLLVTLVVPVISCRKSSSANNGAAHPVQIYLTDDPSLTFDNVFIDIRKLEIKVEDSAEDRQERNGESESDDRDRHGDNSGGWIALPVRPGIYDILQFRNGLDTLLGVGSFSNLQHLRKVRLTLGQNNSVISGGKTTPLLIDGNNNIIVIKFSDDFLDDNPSAIAFTLDFDAGRSIRIHGKELELRPEVKAFRKERAGRIEGKVLPMEAHPVVTVFNASDTTTAKPGSEGEFLIGGLKPGVYSMMIHATTGAFRDTTLTNIVVPAREDVKVGTITLHL